MSNTPSVNKYQVGGEHYSRGGAIQHWDLVELNGLGYLEGCATKYVTRWRNKNGVQDLEKAVHYITKLIYLSRPSYVTILGMQFSRKPLRSNRVRYPLVVSLEAYSEAYELTKNEELIIHLLLTWSKQDHLYEARSLIIGLINSQIKV